jgi:hypothetical protein
MRNRDKGLKTTIDGESLNAMIKEINKIHYKEERLCTQSGIL